jgi:hypothetical protein
MFSCSDAILIDNWEAKQQEASDDDEETYKKPVAAINDNDSDESDVENAKKSMIDIARVRRAYDGLRHDTPSLADYDGLLMVTEFCGTDCRRTPDVRNVEAATSNRRTVKRLCCCCCCGSSQNYERQRIAKITVANPAAVSCSRIDETNGV